MPSRRRQQQQQQQRRRRRRRQRRLPDSGSLYCICSCTHAHLCAPALCIRMCASVCELATGINPRFRQHFIVLFSFFCRNV